MTTGSAGSDAGTAPAPGPMQAIVQDAYGEPDVLRLAEIERPPIAADQVLVRVHAAGVDQGAWHLMTGLPYPVRLAGYGVRAPRTAVRGRELAGRVEAVGRAVTAFAPGDEVFGVGEGTFAEYAPASARKLAPKPANLSFRQAAALPISGLTALQAVRDQGRVRAGNRVLVIGASGGVGTFAVQIAKAFGAEVTGVCSTGKVDVVRSLGADHVVDYLVDDGLGAGERGYDVILDTGGNRSLRLLRGALAPTGTLVIVGAETGGRWLGGIDRQLRAMLWSPFIGQHLRSFVASEDASDLVALSELVAAGTVTPVLDRSFPLHETPEAIRHLRAGRARGKVVIDV